MAIAENEKQCKHTAEYFIPNVKNVQESFTIRSQTASQWSKNDLNNENYYCSSPMISVLKNNNKESHYESFDEVMEWVKICEHMSSFNLFEAWSKFLKIDEVIFFFQFFFFLFIIVYLCMSICGFMGLLILRFLLSANDFLNLE